MNTKPIQDKNEPPDSSNPTTTAKLSSSYSSKTVLCEECDQEPAKLECVECEQYLCPTCDQQIHKRGARKNHQRSLYIPHEESFSPERKESKESNKSSLSSSPEPKTQPPSKPLFVPSVSRFSSASTDSSSLPYTSGYSSFLPKGGFKPPLPRILLVPI